MALRGEEGLNNSLEGLHLGLKLLELVLELEVLLLEEGGLVQVGCLHLPLLLARLGGGHVVVGPSADVLLVSGVVGKDPGGHVGLRCRGGRAGSAPGFQDDNVGLAPSSGLPLVLTLSLARRGGGAGGGAVIIVVRGGRGLLEVLHRLEGRFRVEREMGGCGLTWLGCHFKDSGHRDCGDGGVVCGELGLGENLGLVGGG